jgi:hypothetical protein
MLLGEGGRGMAELDPGHPDELIKLLTNWLRESQSPVGSLLPVGIDPAEWAVRQFINSWKQTARRAIESIEESLSKAEALCTSGGSREEIVAEVENARSTLQEDLRDHLGLYDWNKEN